MYGVLVLRTALTVQTSIRIHIVLTVPHLYIEMEDLFMFSTDDGVAFTVQVLEEELFSQEVTSTNCCTPLLICTVHTYKNTDCT